MDNYNKTVRHKNCLSWNAHGLSNKMNELKELAERIKPGLILITETHINNNKKPPKLKGYECISENVRERRNGGIAIYVHNTINYCRHPIETEVMEVLAIKTGDLVIVAGTEHRELTSKMPT